MNNGINFEISMAGYGLATPLSEMVAKHVRLKGWKQHCPLVEIYYNNNKIMNVKEFVYVIQISLDFHLYKMYLAIDL